MATLAFQRMSGNGLRMMKKVTLIAANRLPILPFPRRPGLGDWWPHLLSHESICSCFPCCFLFLLGDLCKTFFEVMLRQDTTPIVVVDDNPGGLMGPVPGVTEEAVKAAPEVL